METNNDDFDDFDAGDGGDFDDYSDSSMESDLDGANEPLAFLGELPDGLDDDDVTVVQSFFADLDQKLPPDVGQELLQRYCSLVEEHESRQVFQDEAACDRAMATLRDAWGGEHEANLNMLRSALKSQPFADDLLDARFPDGRAIFNDPNFALWLHRLIKGSPGNEPRSRNLDALKNEMLEIENAMGTPRYTKNPRMQARYRELIDLVGGTP